jgi:tetratricopeptide (TPR) repeat protein
MENTLKKLIEKGEIAREQNDFQTALAAFETVLIESIKVSNYSTAINVLGHRLLVFDKLYKQTGNVAFLELMFMDTQIGIRLAEKNHIHGQPLAVMQMREAEYYLDTKDFSLAEKNYQKAFDELSSDPAVTNEEKAEYLGHLAESVIYQGETDRAELLFKKSHELLQKHSEQLRGFHKLIIQSGLLMRQCYGLFLNHQVDKAQALLLEMEPLVLELKNAHNMDSRYKQWLELKSKISAQSY